MHNKISAFVGIVFILAFRVEPSDAQRKLEVGYLTPSVTFGPLFVTKHAGFFDKNGLDIELVFIQPAVLTQALVAGNIPIGIAGPLEIEASLRGADLVLLGTLGRTPALGFLVTRKEIVTTDQLKGKRLGISRLGAAPHRILELILQKLSLDPVKDVTVLQAGGSSARLLAVQAATIDGTLVSIDNASAARKAGLNLLVDVRKIGVEYLTGSVVTSRSFMNHNEDTIRRFMKAIIEGIHYFKTNKENSIQIMATYLKSFDQASLEFGYNWVAEDLQPKPYVRLPAVKSVLESIATRNPAAKEVKPERFMDLKFVRELDKTGFIDALYK
jgi:ABC-type nitrate/sulfonate/bicarbonate transport system substrate-binding protein